MPLIWEYMLRNSLPDEMECSVIETTKMQYLQKEYVSKFSTAPLDLYFCKIWTTFVNAVPVAGDFLCADTFHYKGPTGLKKRHTVKTLIT